MASKLLPVAASCLSLLLFSCAEEESSIFIRIHNASDKVYTGVQIDPTAGEDHFIHFDSLDAGGYSGYIEVPQAYAYPIIDVSCFYATYSFVPNEENPVIANNPGSYTYHLNIVPGQGGDKLVVEQTEE
jgi:hypothetical protein